jgi:hypothetical protein
MKAIIKLRRQPRERIVLNAAQSRRFVKALLAPPRPPTPAMKRAMKLYRETVISDVSDWNHLTPRPLPPCSPRNSAVCHAGRSRSPAVLKIGHPKKST